jgi:hypothetical protein
MLKSSCLQLVLELCFAIKLAQDWCELPKCGDHSLSGQKEAPKACEQCSGDLF